MRKLVLSLGLAAFGIGLFACAGDVGLVDRTQPGKLHKSALEGEWFYRQTVVNVPYTVGVTFIGEQSLLDRVRWEISEDFLTAYRTYERVQGSEVPSQLPGTEYQGAPVAAFKIIKQFDVVREYNTATGEQSNVLVENDFDRPWYDRAYMRVDWSTNLLANFDFIAGGETGLAVMAQAASYAVTDPDDPDAPVFGVRQGDGWQDHRDPMEWGKLESIDYFDLTLKLQITPDVFLLWYDDGTTEEWPACWFYEWGPWDCASQTVKVRASFLKATPSDYEPLYYPDNYIARDSEGEAIRTMWDPSVGMRRCTADEGVDCTPVRIPMFDRFGYFRVEREAYDRDYRVTEEGRVYLINRFNMWQRSVDQAGNTMPMSVRPPKTIVYHLSAGFPEDLVSTAEQMAGWWNQAFSDTVNSIKGTSANNRMFVVSRNTFNASGGKITDFGQRNGDLRYNHVYWVDNPQFESLLGYGPSAADPITGEIIAADAYVYGAAIDSYAVRSADVVDLMRGDILETEFIEGENVGHAIARIGGNRPGISRQAMTQRVQKRMDHGLSQRLSDIRTAGRESFRRNHDYASARIALADDDPRFAGLWNDEVRMAYESRLGRRLKPSEFAAGRLARALRRHRIGLAKRSVLLRGFEDAAVLGLVDRMQGRSRQEVIAYIRQALFNSTAAHEVGHTLGLRHNFAGSTDALNYTDAYWQMRAPSARALDLPTRAEMTLGIREQSYSSIMDYGAKFMSDINGIGKYDVAAIKFGYGQLVETFTNPPWWEDHEILEIYTLDDAVDSWTHYTALPELFDTVSGAGDGRANMASRTDIPMSDMVAWMTMAPNAPDLTDTVVPYKFCSDEYVGALWDCDMWDEGADSYEIVRYAMQTYDDYYIFDAFKRNRRYIDPIEYYYGIYYYVMAPMASQYQHWLFDQWWKAGEWAWLADWDATYGTDITDNSNWNLDPKGGLAFTAASMASTNFLARVVATPEPGSYYTDPDTGNLLWWANWEDTICTPAQNSAVDDCSDIYIPIGEGHYAYSEFDADSGYYWYERVRVIGSFWDKLAAIETLADPSVYFLGVDDVADYTTYVLGFNVAFPHTIGTLFGAVINDDYKKYGAQLELDGTMSIPDIFENEFAAYNDQPAPDRPGPFIDPATNFTVSLYTMFYGMALLNASFDQSFNDNAKIYLEGSGEAINPAAGLAVATFTNPYNGRIYHAVESPDPLAYSLGFEMLSRANQISAQISTNTACGDFFASNDPCSGLRWELQNLIENVEVMRGYYDLFGYAWF